MKTIKLSQVSFNSGVIKIHADITLMSPTFGKRYTVFRIKNSGYSSIRLVFAKHLAPLLDIPYKGRVELQLTESGRFELAIILTDRATDLTPDCTIHIMKYCKKKFFIKDLLSLTNFKINDFEVKIEGGETMERYNLAILGDGKKVYIYYPKDFDFSFPCDCKLVKLNNRNYLLVPNKNYITVHLQLDGGYRGSSHFYNIPDNVEYVIYHHYRSPRGSLGIYEYGLFSFAKSSGSITLNWHQSGRLYGDEPDYTITIDNRGNVVMEPFTGITEAQLDEVMKKEGGC